MAHYLIQRRDLEQSLSAKRGTRLGDKRTGSIDETRRSGESRTGKSSTMKGGKPLAGKFPMVRGQVYEKA